MDLLIRNVPMHILEALRLRARERGRSVRVEALEALERGIVPIGRSLVEYLRTVAYSGTDADVAAGLRAIRQTRDER